MNPYSPALKLMYNCSSEDVLEKYQRYILSKCQPRLVLYLLLVSVQR